MEDARHRKPRRKYLALDNLLTVLKLPLIIRARPHIHEFICRIGRNGLPSGGIRLQLCSNGSGERGQLCAERSLNRVALSVAWSHDESIRLPPSALFLVQGKSISRLSLHAICFATSHSGSTSIKMGARNRPHTVPSRSL